MPGTVTGSTGYIYRDLGRGLSSAAALQRVGKGGTLAAGGGQITQDLSVAGAGNDTSTTEVTLFTRTLPPNTLDIAGRCITLMAFGNVSATSATKTVKLYFGSISVSAVYTTTQTGSWQFYMMVWKQADNVQIALTELDAVGASTARNVTVTTNGANTDTSAIICKITGQASAATANLVTCNGFQICGFN